MCARSGLNDERSEKSVFSVLNKAHKDFSFKVNWRMMVTFIVFFLHIDCKIGQKLLGDWMLLIRPVHALSWVYTGHDGITVVVRQVFILEMHGKPEVVFPHPPSE